MIELLLLFLFYSPYDYSVTAEVQFLPALTADDSGVHGWYRNHDETHYIDFYGQYWLWNSLGYSIWQHEWLHVHCGVWHSPPSENLPSFIYFNKRYCLSLYGDKVV